MRKVKLHTRITARNSAILEQMIQRPGVTKSALTDAALTAYFETADQNGLDPRLLTRLDAFDIRQNNIERDVSLCVETLGQFLLYWLTRTEPLQPGERDEAHRLGQKRFDYFIEQVARKIGSDKGLSRRIENGINASVQPLLYGPLFILFLARVDACRALDAGGHDCTV